MEFLAGEPPQGFIQMFIPVSPARLYMTWASAVRVSLLRALCVCVCEVYRATEHDTVRDTVR